MLRTGKHITSDIKCCRCHKYIGWKYVENKKYKYRLKHMNHQKNIKKEK